jgi:hypothetical protein
MRAKELVVVVLACTIIALAACRRETVYYPPLKLGGDVEQAQHEPGHK